MFYNLLRKLLQGMQYNATMQAKAASAARRHGHPMEMEAEESDLLKSVIQTIFLV